MLNSPLGINVCVCVCVCVCECVCVWVGVCGCVCVCVCAVPVAQASSFNHFPHVDILLIVRAGVLLQSKLCPSGCVGKLNTLLIEVTCSTSLKNLI